MTPPRSPQHLAFIRSLPCCVCGSTRNVEAAHFPGARGLGQKRSDFETGPLCRIHHAEQHRTGWVRFIRAHDLDVAEILKELRERPRLFIIPLAGGWTGPESTNTLHYYPHFNASYKGHEFYLTAVKDGLKTALACAFRVCGEYLREEMIRRVRA